MKKLFLPMAALVVAASLVLPMATPAMAHDASDPQDQRLYAGQGETLEVGLVRVWNDADFLYVRFYLRTPGPWQFVKTDLHVATSLDGIPHNKNGSPKVGQFDYSESYGLDPAVLAYNYVIDLDWSVDTTLYIAAHADVVSCSGDICRDETAWAGGCGSFEFDGNSWATYFTYVVQ